MHQTVNRSTAFSRVPPGGSRDFNAGLFAFRLAVLLSWADSIGRAPFPCALVPSHWYADTIAQCVATCHLNAPFNPLEALNGRRISFAGVLGGTA